MKEQPKPAFDVEALKRQLAGLRANVEDLAETIAAGLDLTRARTKQAPGNGKGLAAPAHDLGRERAYAADQAIEQAVTERPLVSVLIAAAIGFLVGILIRR